MVAAAPPAMGQGQIASAQSTAVGVPTSPALWLVPVFALLLVGGLAYLVGRWRERLQQAPVLFEARSALRQHQQLLQDHYRWQTDARHQLLRWQAPGQGPAADPQALLGRFEPALLTSLQGQQSFVGLQVEAISAWDGARRWEWRGVAQYDESSRFTGFVGTARALDEQVDRDLRGQALTVALRAHPAAAVLAFYDGRTWGVRMFNAAAAQLWPSLEEGMPWAALAPLLSGALPNPLLDELTTMMQSSTADSGPVQTAHWRCETFAIGTPAQRGLLLLQQAVKTPPAGEMTAQEGDTFSFTVSHDLRAPIRIVEGFTRIVKEDYGKQLDRVGNDHLDRVLGAATRMNLMIDALLTLARLSTQPLTQQPVNLSQLASYIADDLRRSAPEREADIDIEPQLLAHGDPTLLRLVLENLLGNAWKYSARCHRTVISLRTVAHQGPPGSNAGRAFVVRDNGAGFDMRSAERLFGLFQRLHSNSDFPGHGVGLASVRRIVKRHGGEIWAEAEVGRGAAFYFTLAG